LQGIGTLMSSLVVPMMTHKYRGSQ
jgi:hypothetical protein